MFPLLLGKFRFLNKILNQNSIEHMEIIKEQYKIIFIDSKDFIDDYPVTLGIIKVKKDCILIETISKSSNFSGTEVISVVDRYAVQLKLETGKHIKLCNESCIIYPNINIRIPLFELEIFTKLYDIYNNFGYFPINIDKDEYLNDKLTSQNQRYILLNKSRDYFVE